jgi:hypothetical protein
MSLALAFSMSSTAISGTCPLQVSGSAKYVLDKAQIGADEWMAKRAELAEEHKTPDAREQLKQGFKNWMSSDLFKEQRPTAVPVPKSTKTIIVEDE